MYGFISAEANSATSQFQRKSGKEHAVLEEVSSAMQIDVETKPGSSNLKKRKLNRELFPAPAKKGVTEERNIIPAPPTCRHLSISEIGFTKERFYVDAKVLNVYGTFESTKDYSKYLKTDLADASGYNTVTFIVGQNYIDTCKEIIVIVDTYLRIEGANVLARNPNDGGSIEFSLNVNARTDITSIPSFTCELFFVPELSIRSFFEKAATKSPNLKTTIAFVIVQVDNILKAEGGIFEQLMDPLH